MNQLNCRPAILQIRLSLLSAFAIMVVFLSCSSGCQEPRTAAPPKKDTSIINKVTQDIGEAKPGAEKADLQAKSAAGAYGFAVAETSKLQIKQAVELYRAANGSYPKDHEEFMSKVIKQNGIQLPVLPGGRQYQYDVENHELIVVEKEQTE